MMHLLDLLGIFLIFLMMSYPKLPLKVSFFRAAQFLRKYIANFIWLDGLVVPCVASSTYLRDDTKHGGTEEFDWAFLFIKLKSLNKEIVKCHVI